MTELAARAEHWALTLTRIPSVTGTPDEVAFAETLCGLLRASPAFRDRPDDVWTIPTGDRLGRASVAALLRGRGRRTVVLTGHFDTVTVADYGDLAAAGDRARAPEGRPAGPAAAGCAQRGRAAGPGRPVRAGLPARPRAARHEGRPRRRPGGAGGGGRASRSARATCCSSPCRTRRSTPPAPAAPPVPCPALAERLGLSLDAAINLDCLGDDRRRPLRPVGGAGQRRQAAAERAGGRPCRPCRRDDPRRQRRRPGRRHRRRGGMGAGADREPGQHLRHPGRRCWA